MIKPNTPRVVNPKPKTIPKKPKGQPLANELVDYYSLAIRSEHMVAGDKLPTESAIMTQFGVSRTVVREALSKLQAAGWVETHHGIGTFVLEAQGASDFHIKPSSVDTGQDILTAMELRIGLESESAALAAVRRTPEQMLAMRAALQQFESSKQQTSDTVNPDYRFHFLLAQATHNRYIIDLTSQLCAVVIPRTRVALQRYSQALKPELARYLSLIHYEHETILAALERQDPDAARAAMRLHLSNSRERLRLGLASVAAE